MIIVRKRRILPRLAIILGVILLLVLLGFLFNSLWLKMQYQTYPRAQLDIVSKYSEKYDVPESLIFAVIKTESGFNASAKSQAGAIGLMQITEETLWWLLSKDGEKDEVGTDQLYDPDTNIKYGTLMLSVLHKEFGDWTTTLAAYNAGRGNAIKWLKDGTISSDGKTLNIEAIPYGETRRYVEKVLKIQKMYEQLYYKKQ